MTTTIYTTTDDYGTPADVESGPRCGNHPRAWSVRHENAAAIRACYAISREQAAEQQAEMYAEAVMSWVAGGGRRGQPGRRQPLRRCGGRWEHLGRRHR